MDTVIKVRNLKRDYTFNNGIFKKVKKTTHAINDISFEVKRGEIFGLLGPNGAGKTTTIKILTTLLAPSGGEVEVLGYKPFGEEKLLRPLINFIYGGERNLYWRLSARDNLLYFSDLYKIPKKVKEERIPELLKLVGLEERGDERVENFSKGMKQRLQIARGLVNDPEILFMDEPTIGLDPVGAKELRNIVKNLSQKGKTIVITTHYMYEADELCDRLAIMDKGKILALDTTANIKKGKNEASMLEIKVSPLSDSTVEQIISEIGESSSVQRQRKDEWDLLKILSVNPSAVMKAIIGYLSDYEIKGIEMKEASLEDIYISYVKESS
ncbi:ABC transporter ATP-binding protein [Paenibacillus sp. 19GGS1-52]|uniref:ABC transporter ATP-binding protein n=1 Tax=Paenibacillus sp. 19GGS1-52 TaxID=2758563 RepID=UPI001EFA36F8|nr:ABC transporter ATP-binding protein [Paenibacillus sp. 19GGS1-52]ULO05923.1 ABC transporter ATP-binding protein [Paenibacillus sp. 19GGS1-52]